MNNCIFANKCTKYICDNSCPTFIESDYLLSRNNLSVQSKVFNSSARQIAAYNEFLDRHSAGLAVITTSASISVSQLLTYVAICKHWKGNRLHCSVYHLKFAAYLEAIQRSYTVKTLPEDFEYQEIWLKTAKILIISGLDFVNFKDFPAQTLLNLVHERTANNLLTVVVSPPIRNLLGDTSALGFFTKLTSVLSDNIDTEVHV